jgi:hypothetical protein
MVKTHIARIFQEFDRTKPQALVLAYETGLVRPGDQGSAVWEPVIPL